VVGPPSGSFAERLEHLIRHVHPAGRGPYSDAEISEWIAAQGGHLSRTALGKLRSGKQANPTLATLTALAGFFGVPVSYLADTAQDRDDTDVQLATAAVKRDPRVQVIAMRAGKMSPDALQTLLDLSWSLERIERRHAAKDGRDRLS